MTRTDSAYSIKHNLPHGGLPRKGTRLRSFYDWLYERRGRLITLAEFPLYRPKDAATLRDLYGCDIRGATQGRRNASIFAGEWIGKAYIDYVAERNER